jgi:ribosomal protein L13E
MAKLKVNEFYSVKLKKVLKIPEVDVKSVVRKGRKFLVGKYKVKGKEYEAWKIVGKA